MVVRLPLCTQAQQGGGGGREDRGEGREIPEWRGEGCWGKGEEGWEARNKVCQLVQVEEEGLVWRGKGEFGGSTVKRGERRRWVRGEWGWMMG